MYFSSIFVSIIMCFSSKFILKTMCFSSKHFESQIYIFLSDQLYNQPKFKKSYTYRSCRTLLNHFFQNYHPTGCAHDSSVQMLSKHFTFLISDTHMKMCRIFSIESFDVYSQAKLSLIARVTA